VEFIQQNGKTVEGIFRKSGQASQIKQYAALFDSGEDLTFEGESDVHVITGLLKLYLRQMPEPIFPFDLYSNFLLSAISVEMLKACISKIPGIRLPLVKYLIRFLSEMSLCVALTLMDVPNIAIVFGPNILRRKGDDTGAALAETPMVLKANQMMITHYSTLFDDTVPLPLPPAPPAGSVSVPPPPGDIPAGPPSDIPPGPLGEIPDEEDDF